MVHHFTKCIMSTKGGQFVFYKNVQSSWKMCTDDQQNAMEKAWMYKCERERGGRKQIALRFQRDQLYYSPAVAGGVLKMVETPSNQSDWDDSYWFEKYEMGAGEYHLLRAVSKPLRYLCITGREISTSVESARSLRVRVETI